METHLCPSCANAGKAVSGQTVKSMLRQSLRLIDNGATYLFCPSPDCPVVYFPADGEQTFTREQIRERVYQKEPDADDVLVCYCFQHRSADIRLTPPLQQHTIVSDIEEGIRLGQCACDLRNPQGTCCLGNVLKLFKLSR